MAQGFGPPIMDFGTIGDLGKTFGDSFVQGRQIAAQNERKQALAGLAQKGILDPQQLGVELLRIGDLNGAMAAAQLAQTQSDRQWQRQTSERDFNFREQEARRAQGNADRTYRIQESAINRKEGPPSGFRVSADGMRWEPIPGGPQDPATIGAQKKAAEDAKGSKPKPLPSSDANKLVQKGQTLEDVNRFETTFNDSYAGWKSPMIGNIANTVARNAGIGNEQGATWWQDYDRYKNVVRNQLFGSALTATEAAAFEKADINPGMTPAAVRRNLKIQKNAATSAATKMARLYVAQGRDPDEIEGALGVSLESLGVQPKQAAPSQATAAPATAPAQQPGAPAKPGRFVDNFADVPEGARFRAGGRVFRKVNGRAVPEDGGAAP